MEKLLNGFILTFSDNTNHCIEMVQGKITASHWLKELAGKNTEYVGKFTQDETKIKWTTEKTAKNNIRILESKYPDSFRLVAAKEIFGSDWSSILSPDNDNKEITLTSLTDEL